MDGRPLQGASSVRGIGSYERGLLAGFGELADPPEVSLLLSAHQELPAEVTIALRPLGRRIRVIHPTLQPIADTLLVANALRGSNADLYHAIEFGQPLRARLPVVVTVHDLIPFVMPRDYPWVRRARILGLRLLHRADPGQVLHRGTACRMGLVVAIVVFRPNIDKPHLDLAAVRRAGGQWLK